MKMDIRPLTGLRGIAALWVLVYHAFRLTEGLDGIYRAPLALLGAAGYLGVDIFFVLSGFVIALNYADLQATDYGRYLWKRLARIYPVHLFALALFAVALPWSGMQTDTSLGALARTLTLTHAWQLPVPQVWNSPSWSISAEFAAYLVFPLIAFATRRATISVAIGGIAALFAVHFVLVQFGPWPGNMAYGMHRIAVEFTAGVLLYRLWTRRKEAINTATVAALGAVIVGGSVLKLFTDVTASLPVLSCVVVYGLACSTGWLARFTTKLEHLGHISYSLYLLHAIVLGVAYHWIDDKTNPLYVLPALAAASIAALVLADLTYRFVEQPARQWMLKRQHFLAPSTSPASPP